MKEDPTHQRRSGEDIVTSGSSYVLSLDSAMMTTPVQTIKDAERDIEAAEPVLLADEKEPTKEEHQRHHEAGTTSTKENCYSISGSTQSQLSLRLRVGQKENPRQQHQQEEKLAYRTKNRLLPKFLSRKSSSFLSSRGSKFQIPKYQWSALLMSLVIFVLLSAAVIIVCLLYVNAEEDDIRADAQELAKQTGDWFTEQLDQAVMPLFSVAQFATELKMFRDLPNRIGPAGAPQSLPFLPSLPDGSGPPTNRNVTGVCDDPVLNTRYNQIAATVMKHSKMQGVLEKLQLAPEAVVCLMQYPSGGTANATFTPEMLEDGKFLDPKKGWGMDLINDPLSQFASRTALKGEQVVVEGPRPIRQCMECDPYFIARLPIPYDGHDMEVDGALYKRWGLATALINWKKLLDRSRMYETFARKNYLFRLTRTDRYFNQETQQYDVNVVVLAETLGVTEQDFIQGAVTTSLQTTNNEWELSVCYHHVDWGQWRYWVISVGVVLSCFIASLVYTVIVQKHMHAVLQGEQKAQDARVEMERNMTAYFAHELRNPLHAIDSALHSMPDHLPRPAEELLSGMRLCAQFMSSIMNNLLDVRKMEEGQLQLRRDPLSLQTLLYSVHKMLTPSVNAAVKFSIQCRTHVNNNWVLGDFHRIEQVLTNVITNSIKHTTSGSITLTCDWDDATGQVKFQCIDTGPGIPKNEHERLFEKYVQRGGAPGTGLGLSISLGIVKLMGGNISFESDPTVKPGTTCTVTLPLPLCKEPEPENASPDASSMDSAPTDLNSLLQEPISFLLLDDIKMNRMMLKRRIQKSIAPNASVTEAATGEEALQICANTNKRFDIIIIDQYMVEAGGILLGTDVVIALRRMGVDSLLIGCSGNDLEEEFLSAGADFVWTKPMPSTAEIIRQLRDGLQL